MYAVVDIPLMGMSVATPMFPFSPIQMITSKILISFVNDIV